MTGAKHLTLEEFEAKLPSLVKNKTAPLILVCPTGMRARRAVAVAKKLGYENTRALNGGMRAWREAGLPIVKG